MERKFRIGIIGCGGIANSKHMPSLTRQPNAELVAFCDIVEEARRRPAKSSARRARRSTPIIRRF